jgi:hypothetical protein
MNFYFASMLMLVFLATSSSYANESFSWIGPIEVLSDKFERFGGQVGLSLSLEGGDCCCGGPAIEDEYPKEIRVDDDDNVIIGDWRSAGGKIHIFNKYGKRINIIHRNVRENKCKNIGSYYWPGTIKVSQHKIIVETGYSTEVYTYTGEYQWCLGISNAGYPELIDAYDNKIFFKNYIKRPDFDSEKTPHNWLIYDLNGKLILRTDENQDRLRRQGSTLYYNNTFSFNDPISNDPHYTEIYDDKSKYVYVVQINYKPQNFEKISTYHPGHVSIYSETFQPLFNVVLSMNRYAKSNRTCGGEDGRAVFAGKDVIEEYGMGATVSKNGDIYMTLYRPTEFKIVKWQKINIEKPIPHEVLSKLNKPALRLLRNEIFARKGRRFDAKDLMDYFSAQPWYKANDHYSDDHLSKADKENISLILTLEEKAKE